MNQSYVKKCNSCKKKIHTSDKTSEWLQYNENGSQHDCKTKEEEKTNNGNGNNDISIQVLLKKLESIGISINFEQLRNSVNGDKK